MRKSIVAVLLGLAVIVPVLPAVADDGAIEQEALRRALEQALRENIELRAELETARMEMDRLRTAPVMTGDVMAAAPIVGSFVAAPMSSGRTHTVAQGETLGKIAEIHYKNAGAFRKIFEANADKLKDPNLIYVGQVLKIP